MYDNFSCSFENESIKARNGDLGIAYIDYPNNCWKFASLLKPQRMRYICWMDNPCLDSLNRCGSKTQCVFNTSSGLFYCQNNATRCEDGVTCLNGGTCVDQADGYVCRCPGYFTGQHCEHYNSCETSNPCQNGGTCYNKQSNHETRCQCTDGYYGDKCQFDVSKCSIGYSACYQCIESSSSRHYCLCPHPEQLDSQLCVSSEFALLCWEKAQMQWTIDVVNQLSQFVRPYVDINGSMACGCDDDDVMDNNCEIDVNECASSPCLNGGKCVDRKDGYECDCKTTGLPGEYGGDHCQYRKGNCIPNLCQHGGTCVAEYIISLAYVEYCNCDYTGYTGGFCHTELDECQSDPCLHNAGFYSAPRRLRHHPPDLRFLHAHPRVHRGRRSGRALVLPPGRHVPTLDAIFLHKEIVR